MPKHEHSIQVPLFNCVCGATAEQVFNGELAHPGKPTSERLWELQLILWKMHHASN